MITKNGIQVNEFEEAHLAERIFIARLNQRLSSEFYIGWNLGKGAQTAPADAMIFFINPKTKEILGRFPIDLEMVKEPRFKDGIYALKGIWRSSHRILKRKMNKLKEGKKIKGLLFFSPFGDGFTFIPSSLFNKNTQIFNLSVPIKGYQTSYGTQDYSCVMSWNELAQEDNNGNISVNNIDTLSILFKEILNENNT